jgi:hypothetical protein
MMPYDYAFAAIMALLVASIHRFLKHGIPLITTVRSMMIDPFLVWYDYVIAAVMALVAFSILFSHHHGIPLNAKVLSIMINHPRLLVLAIVLFLGFSVMISMLRLQSLQRQRERELHAPRMFNHNVHDHDDADIPYSVLLDDDNGDTKKWLLASLRTNLVLAYILDGQAVAAKELQRFGIDPLRVILLSSLPHYQQAGIDDDDDRDEGYEDDVRPRRRRRRRGYPDGYGQRVQFILHGLAQATLNSVYYQALSRPMMMIHPRLHYNPDVLVHYSYGCRHENDHHLGRAIVASFQLNVLLATMLGQNDSARALESIADWLETVVAATGVPIIPWSIAERGRQWRNVWRSAAARMPHDALQVLRNLEVQVANRYDRLHADSVSRMLRNPYDTMTNHRRVAINTGLVQQASGRFANARPRRGGLCGRSSTDRK